MGSYPPPQGCRAVPEALMRPGTRANPGLPWPRQILPWRRLSISTVTAVTMQDLGLDHAELLAARGNPLLLLPAPFGGGGSSFTHVGTATLLRG